MYLNYLKDKNWGIESPDTSNIDPNEILWMSALLFTSLWSVWYKKAKSINYIKYGPNAGQMFCCATLLIHWHIQIIEALNNQVL